MNIYATDFPFKVATQKPPSPASHAGHAQAQINTTQPAAPLSLHPPRVILMKFSRSRVQHTRWMQHSIPQTCSLRSVSPPTAFSVLYRIDR